MYDPINDNSMIINYDQMVLYLTQIMASLRLNRDNMEPMEKKTVLEKTRNIVKLMKIEGYEKDYKKYMESNT